MNNLIPPAPDSEQALSLAVQDAPIAVNASAPVTTEDDLGGATESKEGPQPEEPDRVPENDWQIFKRELQDNLNLDFETKLKTWQRTDGPWDQRKWHEKLHNTYLEYTQFVEAQKTDFAERLSTAAQASQKWALAEGPVS